MIGPPGGELPVLRGSATTPIVLASASAVRHDILRGAGVPAIQDPAHIDEAEVKAALLGEGASAARAAETLAELKARHVARRHGGALVIGADQILECEGAWFDKPANLGAARRHLEALSGRVHNLLTAVCVLRDDARLWHFNAAARLQVRPLGEEFVTAYLAAAGNDVLNSPGAYRLEGPGAQLFGRIEGDYFAILGLPLLPLLEFLRAHEIVPS